MSRSVTSLALAAGIVLPSAQAVAHGFAGPHMFISTLLIDDPNAAADEGLVPHVFLPAAAERRQGPVSNLCRRRVRVR